jgi:two-component system, OmpR family, sensor histidine kinase PrrB
VKRPLSIRTRVTIAATAAVALVLIGGGILTVTTFANRERSSFDRELEHRAEGPAGRTPALLLPAPQSSEGGSPERDHLRGADGRGVRVPPPQGPDVGGPGLLAESGFFVRVVRDDQVIRTAGDVPSGGFPVPEKAGFETVEADGRRWRSYTVEPRDEGPFQSVQSATRAQFVADLQPVDDRIGSMRTRVAVISGLGIVLAAVLASFLSGLALAPFSRLRRAVAGVTSTRELSHRLPDSGAAEEVNELGRSVNAMLTRLEHSAEETESALVATRRFAADVGHEVRTPLTSIRANVDALRRNPAMNERERKVILDEVAAEQDQLVALLDALQALARGDAGASLPKERLDFAEIVDAAIESARRRHPGAKIEVSATEERQQIVGWPDGLRLLIDNLIENAVRHGGSRVRVAMRRRDGEGLLLSVEDDGPGVPPVEREHIFERFQRGTGAVGDGTGLGLALVAQQAALHGGKVSVADSALGGAAFEVSLPLARDP